MPPDFHQEPAQVVRRPGGLEYSVFLGGERRQAEFVFQMEDQVFDIRFIQSQLRQAGVVVEVIPSFKHPADVKMDGGAHGSSFHGRSSTALL